MPKLANDTKCTGCMLCQNICPHKAISMTQKNGFSYPKINKEKCIECKLCERFCPIVGDKKIEIETKTIKATPYSAKSIDNVLRIQSASGGFLTELARYFFEKYKSKCFIAGAVIDGVKVHHIVTNRIEDLSAIQGSKYLQSDIGLTYNTIFKLLKEDNFVLFTGLPCQAYALKLYLHNKKYSGSLITCDLICNGVPSYNLLEIDIKNNLKDIKRIIAFRDKIDSWSNCLAFSYENKNSQIIRNDGESSFFLKSFKTNYALRNSCYKCPYCKINRVTDFTVGDFWGGKLSSEDQKKGVSLVLCHNENARRILNNMPTIDYKPIDWKECLPGNPRIFCGKRFIQWIIPRKMLYILLDSNNYKIQEQLLTNNLGTISQKRYYWIILKIWGIITLKIEHNYRNIILKKTLKQLRNSQ